MDMGADVQYRYYTDPKKHQRLRVKGIYDYFVRKRQAVIRAPWLTEQQFASPVYGAPTFSEQRMITPEDAPKELPANGPMEWEVDFGLPSDVNVTNLPEWGQKGYLNAKLDVSCSTAFKETDWVWTVDVSQFLDVAVATAVHATSNDQYVRSYFMTAYGQLRTLGPFTRIKYKLRFAIANTPDSYDDTLNFSCSVSLFGYRIGVQLFQVIDAERRFAQDREWNDYGDPVCEVRYLFEKRGVFEMVAGSPTDPDSFELI